MGNAMARFIGLSPKHETREPRFGGASGPIGSDHRNLYVYYNSCDSYLRHSRLIKHESPEYKGNPVLYDSDSSPLDRTVLKGIELRANQMVNYYGTCAAMMRCDWPAGTKRDAISALMTALKTNANRHSTEIHYLVVPEYSEGQEGNHYHGVIWYDRCALDYPDTPKRYWRRIRDAFELPLDCRIIWRRDRNKPHRFYIGQSQAEFRDAFRAASYLAKTSQPPQLNPGETSRIISRISKNRVRRLSQLLVFPKKSIASPPFFDGWTEIDTPTWPDTSAPEKGEIGATFFNINRSL